MAQEAGRVHISYEICECSMRTGAKAFDVSIAANYQMFVAMILGLTALLSDISISNTI